jgi:hypothetical protein
MKVGIALLKILGELFLEIPGEEILKELGNLKTGYGLGKLCPPAEILVSEANKVKLTPRKFQKLVINNRKTISPPTEFATPLKLDQPSQTFSTQDQDPFSLPPINRWSLATTSVNTQKSEDEPTPDNSQEEMCRSESTDLFNQKAKREQKSGNVSKVPTLPDIYNWKINSAFLSDDDEEINDRLDSEMDYNPNIG